jgi:hypothetical protein
MKRAVLLFAVSLFAFGPAAARAADRPLVIKVRGDDAKVGKQRVKLPPSKPAPKAPVAVDPPPDDAPAPVERKPEPTTAPQADASRASAQAHVEPDPVRFAEPFTLVVEVTRDRGLAIDLPGELPQNERVQRTGEVTRDVVELPVARPGDTPRVKETIRIPFVALDTEKTSTPALVLKAHDGTTLEVAALDVKVTDPQAPAAKPDAGPADLEPATPHLSYEVPDRRPLYALAALAGLVAAVVLARKASRALAARRRQQPVPVIAPPPPRPAHLIALEKLDALLAEGLLQKGEVPVFVERLMNEVLREYLEGRFGLPAGKRTTRELVESLLSFPVAGLDVRLVEGVLADADLVKFARAKMAREDAHAMATRVRSLIVNTAPDVDTRTDTRTDLKPGGPR